ncbi:MAG: MotA/TolQ/ExbB proton channel family protein [Planctomycetaceae bacterium]|jgi:biopolymer transport protein ExbB|nr:MotA/TolQ/ExbB proton channel family protein [Planctomycetaceae bacterium]
MNKPFLIRIIFVPLSLSILFGLLSDFYPCAAETIDLRISLFAQADAVTGNTNEKDNALQQAQNETYLYWSIKSVGPIFTPIFIVDSVIFLTLAITNWLAIRRDNIMPATLMSQFVELLDKKEYQAAYELAKESDSSQGKIFAAGLAKMSAGYATAEKMMNDIAEEEIMVLEHRLSFLALIASVSPMIGLLGTVVGMIQTFCVIAQSGIAPNASDLAGGISMALLTTAIGLFIAIPALIFYEILRNKLAKIVFEMSTQTEKIMGRFKT